MSQSGREKIEDEIFNEDLSNEDFHNKLLVRFGAKGKIFTKVNFSHTYFEHCYFRNVTFDSCNFNGCKFINCNFQGSTFPGSNFDYSIFEKTFIESEILDYNCPNENNLKIKFARTLRINFQSIGEASSVNKAIKIELKATEQHLHDAWRSNSFYYRKKYTGWKRFSMFFQWLNFKFQDFIWGNGESYLKLLRTGLVFWVLFSFIDVIFYKDYNYLINYWIALKDNPSYFMGINKPEYYPDLLLTTITTIRFIGFALFTSIIIKRFNKR